MRLDYSESSILEKNLVEGREASVGPTVQLILTSVTERVYLTCPSCCIASLLNNSSSPHFRSQINWLLNHAYILHFFFLFYFGGIFIMKWINSVCVMFCVCSVIVSAIISMLQYLYEHYNSSWSLLSLSVNSPEGFYCCCYSNDLITLHFYTTPQHYNVIRLMRVYLP